jgi:hypothetical protein
VVVFGLNHILVYAIVSLSYHIFHIVDHCGIGFLTKRLYIHFLGTQKYSVKPHYPYLLGRMVELMKAQRVIYGLKI